VSNDPPLVEPNAAFAELGRIVLGEQPLEQILHRVVETAKDTIGAASEVSITLVTADRGWTVAFTADCALALDERQYGAERGPCMDAATGGTRLVVSDTATDARWPLFADAATQAGIRSSLSIPLPVQRQLTGALNFYASRPDAFDDQSLDLAERFAAHAAVTVANAHLYEATAKLADQMQQAMATRAVIEQAKGIVMREQGCSADEAFASLVSLSQQSHMKLRDVAQRLVDGVTGPSPNGPRTFSSARIVSPPAAAEPTAHRRGT